MSIIKKKKIEESVENEKVSELLSILRDENFGNEDQRKKMIDILTSLFNIKDKDARTIFKRLGMALTDIGNDMLGSDDDEVEEIEVFDDEVEEVDIYEDISESYQLPTMRRWKGIGK